MTMEMFEITQREVAKKCKSLKGVIFQHVYLIFCDMVTFRFT